MMDVKTLAAAVLALIDTVDEIAEGVPSGTAFLAMQTVGVDYHTYHTIVQKTVEAGYLTQSNHLLTITPKGHEFVEKARSAVKASKAVA